MNTRFSEKAVWVVPAVVMLLVSCQSQIPMDKTMAEPIAVNSILIAGAAEQHLLLTTVVKNENDQLVYLQDARVEVNGVSFTSIPLERIDPQNPYNWLNSELELQYGQLCSLRIFYKEQTIRGETVIPSPVEPVLISGAVITWKNDSSHFQYAVWLNDAYFGYLTEPKFDARSSYFLFRPGRYRVRILAFDKNYRQKIISNSASIGLEGAYGLFASACAREDSVELK